MAKNPAADPAASPGSYTPAKPNPGPSRKSYNKIVFALAVLAVILMVSILDSGKKESEQGRQKPYEPETRDLLPSDERHGLNQFPKPPDSRSGLNPPLETESPLIPPDEQGVLVVGPPEADPLEEERKRNEADERRRRREAHFAALNSRLAVKTTAPGERNPESSPGPPPAGTDQRPAEVSVTGEYDPAADRDKEKFFQRSEAAAWMSPYTRENGHPYEIKTGSVIPGLMVTGVISDLPGNLAAQVSQNVFDSATGRYLLIPQGSKIYGVYDSRVVYGQERVLVAWNRILFPDGSTVTLGAMPGTDMAGNAGLTDTVDNHYWRIFGSAVLMSLITGGAAYVMDNSGGSSAGSAEGTTMKDEMTAALGSQLGQTTAKLLEKNLSLKPTIGVRAGYRFNVITTKDIVFRGPYAPTEVLTGFLGPDWAPVKDQK
jgi:type IV secretion system protein VirB10